MARELLMTSLAIALVALAGCAQTPATRQAAAPAAPAPAAQAAASPQVAATPAAADADGDRVICRKDEATGSRLRSANICKTKREWDQLREEAKRAVDQIEHEKGNTNKLPMGGG